MKIKRLVSMAMAATVVAAMADEAPAQWLRRVAISPDGKQIAFTSGGDIFTVPVEGGRARQITSNPAYDSNPIWSPDGTRLAFSSDRDGAVDIYVVSTDGGTVTRLTTNSVTQTPRAWLNDSTIVFTEWAVPSAVDVNAPFRTYLAAVPARKGARPVRYADVAAGAVSINSQGDMLFQDHKGFENLYRKHERSSSTTDVWLRTADGQFKRLTATNAIDRQPVWIGDGAYAYVTDAANGTLNVVMASLAHPDATVQLTHFEGAPVRSLSASRTGVLAFDRDGVIYTLVPGKEPQPINVSITIDDYDADRINTVRRSGANSMSPSGKGDEVAIVVRGDVYVTSVKYNTTRRITNTAGQEREISFAPDGRSIVYDAERDGQPWCIYIAQLDGDDENASFAYGSDFTERVLYANDEGLAAQQPVFSPDGKKVAFLENRTTLRVIDVASGVTTTALDGDFNYSYADGDIHFEWSPDSKRLLVDYIGIGGWNNTDVAMVSADGSEVVNLTEGGYNDSNAKWALGGKAVTWATSRYGYRSHGSWGEQQDVMIMVLDQEAWERLNMSKEEREREDKLNKSDDDDEDDKKDDTPTPLDLQNRRYRMMRLTPNSTAMGDYYLSPDGTKLYFTAEGADGDDNLMVTDLLEDETSVLVEGYVGGITPDKDGENIFVFTSGGLKKINLESGSAKSISYEARSERHPSAERRYIYDHMVRQVRDKFYDENLHGVDWDSITAAYARFLPAINNANDMAELMSEVLGELNASHTGASSSWMSTSSRMSTANLGAFYDESYTGDGLKVAELLPGSPLANSKANVHVGEVIVAIDGTPILAGEDYFPLLEGRAGEPTRISVRRLGSGIVEDVTVKPQSHGTLRRQIYRRWVEQREKLVDSLSDGRIGYVHIEGMDSESFRTIFDRLLGRYRNCDAVVVDTRWNGGGWLHHDVAMLLNGTEYVRFAPRGHYIGSEPFSQWHKPSVMLVNEANYSDAHGTPYTYRALGVGDIVGSPVPGTMTAVWWETQVDPSIVFGIPEVTSLDRNGNVLENQQLNPDVEVWNTPDATSAGRDLQLEAAVAHLLEKLNKTE